jgi:uncharacterized protein DUF6597
MFKKIIPHPALRTKIEYYWLEESLDSKEKLLPDGSVCILFNLSNDIVSVDIDGQETKIKQEPVIIGPHKSYHILKNSNERKVVGIKFRKGTAYELVKIPITNFVNKTILLETVLNGNAVSAQEKIMQSRSNDDIKNILDAFLFANYDRKKIKFHYFEDC